MSAGTLEQRRPPPVVGGAGSSLARHELTFLELMLLERVRRGRGATRGLLVSAAERPKARAAHSPIPCVRRAGLALK